MVVEYQDEPLKRSRWAVIRWFRLDRFQPERAVTSYWMSSKALLFIRIPTTLYSTIIMWGSIGNSSIQNEFQRYFAHFTQLTFIGLHAYLVTALYHHVRYLMTPQPHQPRSFFNQPSVLNYLFLYLYHSIVVFNIITPIVYWCALSPVASSVDEEVTGMNEPPLQWWINTSFHGVSFVLMMTEVVFTRMTLYVNMVLLVFINVVLYMFLTFIIFATTGWWVYGFLDWSQGGITAAWYIGVGAAFIVVYFVQFLFHMLRDWVARKLGRNPRKPEMRQANDEEAGQFEFRDSGIATHSEPQRY
ncbi:hypothetical protein BDB00DRAFT_817451 [Zychaea mexicana]|uniref:uncharacterized protein n=1 Tax=Zychaea mexicana TaxID=64656 RepID=UPI0022FF12F9|nr:uncharacterized protein BDB00DRAFT_817451 [Zychaea mexicana]KAI9494598.1 hypothetical protein BDB00DRAFT_817451 [Zychaea mexicana]